MPNYLRDQYISSVSLDETAIKQLFEIFQSQKSMLPSELPDQADFFSVIRFDGKGYRVLTINDLINYFNQAKKIERINFFLETKESLSSNHNQGTFIELCFDQKDSNNCYLRVASDDKNWVNSSFALIQDTLSQYKNRHKLIRTNWTSLGVQILGIFFGFLISLWGAIELSPKLIIQNSFVICFFLFFIIFSNIWTYLNGIILQSLNNIFPNIRFFRKDKDTLNLHWIPQAIIGGIALVITIWVIHLISSYFIDIFNSMIIKHP